MTNDRLAPAEFEGALGTLRNARIDPRIGVAEVPAPGGLAPHAAAIQATLEAQPNAGLAGQSATATLVILYDPDQRGTWGGSIRLVGHARMQVDADQSTDPLLGDAVWQTLADALDDSGAAWAALVGSVTREITQTFGGLELVGSALNADLRCSWTALDADLRPQLEGWLDALRTNCGLEPIGVAPLRASSVHVPGHGGAGVHKHSGSATHDRRRGADGPGLVLPLHPKMT